MFLAKRFEREHNRNPWFVVQQTLPAGNRSGLGPTGNVLAVKATWYGPGVGQPGQQAMQNGPPRVGPPKAASGDGKAGYKPGGVASQCYNCGTIDGDEYVPVDIYDNDYYAHDDEEEYQENRRYTPQEKECLVTYVEVNGHPVWMLWDSGSATMGITPQFVHVKTIHVHELMELFGMEAKIKTSRPLTREYVDIANFDPYDMIIGTLFMCKNKVNLNFVNNRVIVNGVPLRAEKIVLADTDGHLQWNVTVEDEAKNLAPVASLPASLLAIMMIEKEFQETLERGDGLDQPKVAGILAVKNACAERVEDLITDEVKEKQQSAASAAEMTNSVRSFWDRPVPPPDMQWAYDPHMLLEWNKVVASMVA
ncbi:hypothetical protein C0993_011797 [Termitomyces sp. T159_Od127]|nr:hypothetical protein C0993_011797 [Termitomyces sp. T159_Od127]